MRISSARRWAPPPHLPETAERTTLPGVVVGLAHTSHGGDILFIEATVLTGGEGVRLRLTGQLGDVMRESAEAALSWVRANADALGLPPAPLDGRRDPSPRPGRRRAERRPLGGDRAGDRVGLRALGSPRARQRRDDG